VILAAAAALLAQAWAGVIAGGGGADLDAAYQPRRVAVLVGVQEYSDPALQGLRYATKDARDLGRVLGDPQLGDFDRVFVIEGASATRRAEMLEAIEVATADLQRDDTFLLYMGGHGTLTLDARAGSRLYFLPSDGVLDRPEATGIAVSDVEEMLHQLPARRRVLVLDTCHNGRGGRSAVAAPTAQLLAGFRGEPPPPRSVLEVSENEARLYAALLYQPAMEDAELQNGVYTHYLVDALSTSRAQADLDGDGLVDVSEAHAYAHDRTIGRTGGLQVPRAEYRVAGREEIFLSGAAGARGAAERAIVSAYDEILRRAKLLVNGTARGELPGTFAVEPGRHVIEIQSAEGSTIARRAMVVRAGERVRLEEMVRDRGPRVGVLGGATLVAGSDYFHSWNGSLMVAVERPVVLPQPWHTDVHLAVATASGLLRRDGEEWTTGMASLGATIGAEIGPGWAGPSVDVRVPFRSHPSEDQATILPAGGLSVGASIPVGALAIMLRADAMGTILGPADAPEPSFVGGLSIGLGSRDP
jgi:hypothetical protein